MPEPRNPREPTTPREPELPVIDDPQPDEPKIPEMPPPVPNPPEIVGGFGIAGTLKALRRRNCYARGRERQQIGRAHV